MQSLSLLLERSQDQHDCMCPGDVMIPLGQADEIEFDVGEGERQPIWIQDGTVYHLISCPSDYHENIASELSQSIISQINEKTKNKTVFEGGNSRFALRNLKGCHAAFNKEPDSCIRLVPAANKNQDYPMIVTEVAVNHENMHTLMCEAAAWLADSLDVAYVIAVKIKIPSDADPSADVWLFENKNKPASQQGKDAFIVNLEKEANFWGKGKTETERKGKTDKKQRIKRFCSRVPKNVNYKDKLSLEDYYGLHLVSHHHLKGHHSRSSRRTKILKMSLQKILQNSSLDLEGASLYSSLIEVDLDEIFNGFYEWVEYRSKRAKRLEASTSGAT